MKIREVKKKFFLRLTMDTMDRDDKNKTQRLYRCYSNYAMSRLIVDNGLEDLWRRESPGSPPSSLATISHLGRIQDRQGLY